MVAGDTAFFGVQASSNSADPLSYQWRFQGVALRGATSSVLTVSRVQSANAGFYDVVVNSKWGTTNSRAATLTVLTPLAPSITTQPADASAEPDKNFQLTVDATGVPAPGFQWRKDGVALPGANSPSLAFNNVQITDSGDYDVIATNPFGAVTSRVATLRVAFQPLNIVTPPIGAHVSWDEAMTFSVNATGRNLRYQWKKNGVAIPGATGASFIVNHATLFDMGFYSVVVSNEDGTLEPDAAIFTVASTTSVSVTTFAGKAPDRTPDGVYLSYSNGNNDGPAKDARFYWPHGVAMDRSGNVFVADTANHTIRKITPTGLVSTLAGSAGHSGATDGTGTAARFREPNSIAIDASGNLFIADTGNNLIRRITPDGTVSTFAGYNNGNYGAIDGVGTAAMFGFPEGLTIDRNGNLFVADSLSCTIRKITPNGVVTTVAGRAFNRATADGAGANAAFYHPAAIAVDSNGTLFVADAGLIRRVTATGAVTTLGNVSTQDLALNQPQGLAIDPKGNLLIADATTIRRLNPDGSLTLVAGKVYGFGSADGSGANAQFEFLHGIAVDAGGNLLVVDADNNTVRRIAMPPITTPSQLVNLSTRGFVPASGMLTPGFSLRGSGSKQLVIRAAGPALTRLGVAGALADPNLQLIPATAKTATASNDDWGTNRNLAALTDASFAVGAFPFEAGSKDAALLTAVKTADDARYTVPVSPNSATTSGIVLAEIYDTDSPDASVRLASVSTLAFVGRGDVALVAGFTLRGTESRRVLIRAVGPGLDQFGFSTSLADPQFSVMPVGQSAVIARNDSWAGAAALVEAFAQVGAFALARDSKDAALIVRLPPGGYTVTVSGVSETTGTALVEIYDLDP